METITVANLVHVFMHEYLHNKHLKLSKIKRQVANEVSDYDMYKHEADIVISKKYADSYAASYKAVGLTYEIANFDYRLSDSDVVLTVQLRSIDGDTSSILPMLIRESMSETYVVILSSHSGRVERRQSQLEALEAAMDDDIAAKRSEVESHIVKELVNGRCGRDLLNANDVYDLVKVEL